MEGRPGETLQRLTTLMETPTKPLPKGVPTTSIPSPSSMRDGGRGAHFIYLVKMMETPQGISAPSPEPPPAVPSTPPPATAMAPLPPPAKSEEVAQPPPPTVLPLPPKEESRPRELTPSPAPRMETAALAPAPLAAEDSSKGGIVPSPEPPPAVPSTPPPATAMAPLPPPAKSEEVAQPPPPTVLPLPSKEESRPRELTPSPAPRMETAALAPAPLAAEDSSKGGIVPSPNRPRRFLRLLHPRRIPSDRRKSEYWRQSCIVSGPKMSSRFPFGVIRN